jgi:hypothetical protein
MARTKGTLALSANFEPQIAAPLDARHVCSTMAELVLPATWTAKDGTVYAYQGMITSVWNDGANNGVYQLNGTDYTVSENWVKVNDDAAGIKTKLESITVETDKLSISAIENLKTELDEIRDLAYAGL